jgi:parvulin-like peptidyl-prolyl isomerase
MRQKNVLRRAVRNKKVLANRLWAMFIFFLFAACQKSQPVEEEPAVARVGAETLTVSDIVNDIPAQLRHRIAKSELQDYVVRWIDSQILFQEGKRRQLDQGEELRRELRRLERELVVNALLDRELNKPFQVTEQEIEKYYNDYRQTFTREANEVHVQFIRVDNKKSADSLTAALRQGGDFLQVARQYAGGDSAASDLFLTEAETPPVVMSAVFTIMTGAVSRPVLLDNGFHIFKMIEKFEAGSQKPLAQVREEITAKILSEKRQERYKQFLAELKNSALIEKNFQLLDNIPSDSLSSGAEQN